MFTLSVFAVSEKFAGKAWRIHPDWVYCEYNYHGLKGHEFDTPEEGMKHFFTKMQSAGWNWGTTRVVPLPQCQNAKPFDPLCVKCKFINF